MLQISNMNEALKFVANGIFATFIHFFFLITFITYTDASYGFSNFIACIFGSISSFLGNKYFVFTFYDQTAQTFVQFFRFLLLYFLLALNAGFTLYFWADIYGFNFIFGFLVITMINVIISFLANKFLIFNHKK